MASTPFIVVGRRPDGHPLCQPSLLEAAGGVIPVGWLLGMEKVKVVRRDSCGMAAPDSAHLACCQPAHTMTPAFARPQPATGSRSPTRSPPLARKKPIASVARAVTGPPCVRLVCLQPTLSMIRLHQPAARLRQQPLIFASSHQLLTQLS
ncbi:hypothetical protein ACLOJK_019057 [Asimina triloba]